MDGFQKQEFTGVRDQFIKVMNEPLIRHGDKKKIKNIYCFFIEFNKFFCLIEKFCKITFLSLSKINRSLIAVKRDENTKEVFPLKCKRGTRALIFVFLQLCWPLDNRKWKGPFACLYIEKKKKEQTYSAGFMSIGFCKVSRGYT